MPTHCLASSGKIMRSRCPFRRVERERGHHLHARFERAFVDVEFRVVVREGARPGRRCSRPSRNTPARARRRTRNLRRPSACGASTTRVGADLAFGQRAHVARLLGVVRGDRVAPQIVERVRRAGRSRTRRAGRVRCVPPSRARTPASNARTVPSSVARDGMTLCVVPACIAPIVTTAGCERIDLARNDLLHARR